MSEQFPLLRYASLSWTGKGKKSNHICKNFNSFVGVGGGGCSDAPKGLTVSEVVVEDGTGCH